MTSVYFTIGKETRRINRETIINTDGISVGRFHPAIKRVEQPEGTQVPGHKATIFIARGDELLRWISLKEGESASVEGIEGIKGLEFTHSPVEQPQGLGIERGR